MDNLHQQPQTTSGSHPPDQAALGLDSETGTKSPAWEMIENGRYRPRRIRGSLLGRELG